MAKILLVEDNEMNRDMLTRRLQRHGFSVCCACDGAEGVAMAATEMPDLILMDMRMPHLDGLSVTRLIRSHPTLNQVPIIAVTGMVTPQFKIEVLRAGCNDCLYKPIDFERLEKLVSNADCTIS